MSGPVPSSESGDGPAPDSFQATLDLAAAGPGINSPDDSGRKVGGLCADKDRCHPPPGPEAGAHILIMRLTGELRRDGSQGRISSQEVDSVAVARSLDAGTTLQILVHRP